jgi:CO dehydrogenase maturation factor
MSTTIALAGKGGVGKTTIAAMVIKYLARAEDGAILGIDADPSSNLNMVLGLNLDWTVGDIREDMLAQVKGSLTTGGAVGSLAEGQAECRITHPVLAEGSAFGLIAMGRSKDGCYCAVNHNRGIDRRHQQELSLHCDRQRGRDGASQPAHHA